MSGLSVIIPTRDRPHLLLRVLQELHDQASTCGGVEIIVIDDGSSSEVLQRIEDLMVGFGDTVKLERQPPAGPAVARNRGLAAAEHPHILFMGDDIIPGPNLLQAHMDFHTSYPHEKVALLGHVTWSPDLEVTPLMHWLENGGPQFCYGKIIDHNHVPAEFFWTANLSAKATFLLSEGGFSPAFPDAAFEDVELGIRLGKRGMRLHYDPHAVGYHFHPMTFRGSLQRMGRLARGALVARETIPDFVYTGRDGSIRRFRRRLALNPFTLSLLSAINPLFRYCPGIRESYYSIVHDLHYRAALRKLLKD